ncbi:TetR/AcrR family transcriptional regulator [Glaciecola siphonariae]|uniref:TetR/AcrR family transcriptional regulator n=1 Tax=Glaciecola siphonariae TaxID=521012 RepID=A0ABV9LZP0_9ALTE
MQAFQVGKQKKTRRKRGQTRPAILDAAVRLLMQEGPETLTTTRLAKEVGIVQSGFYAHFRTIDECLKAVVAEIDTNVRAPLADQMAQLRLTDAGDVELLDEFYHVLFDRVEENWPLMEVFLHFRGDHSSIGKMIADFEMSLVSDLQLHLMEMRDTVSLEKVFGNAPEKMLLALAQMMISQALVGIMQWKLGNISRDVLARLLAEQTSKVGESAKAAGIRIV